MHEGDLAAASHLSKPIDAVRPTMSGCQLSTSRGISKTTVTFGILGMRRKPGKKPAGKETACKDWFHGNVSIGSNMRSEVDKTWLRDPMRSGRRPHSLMRALQQRVRIDADVEMQDVLADPELFVQGNGRCVVKVSLDIDHPSSALGREVAESSD